MSQHKLKVSTLLYIMLHLLFLGCKTHYRNSKPDSSNLQVERLSKHTYQHISYLNTTDYGKVACNGMVVIDKGEALVFDTPVNDQDSEDLIQWIENVLKCKVVGVVVTHFHEDCLGGLSEFHKRNIPSYASNKTIEYAGYDSVTIPQHGFENSLDLEVGSKSVSCEFLGEGHTKDNIVCYFQKEKVLFGGCLVKTLGAGKGYVAVANVAKWSATVGKVKLKYADAKVVIPGHGKPGGLDLLDYTIELFEVK
jgi:metallo-beta-lactamase class B